MIYSRIFYSLMIIINVSQLFGQSSINKYFIGTTVSYGIEMYNNNDTTCHFEVIMIGDKLMKNNVRYYFPCFKDENSIKIDISGENEVINRLTSIITTDFINRIHKCPGRDLSCYLTVSINKYDNPIVGNIEERSIKACCDQNNEVYELIDIIKYLRSKYNN